MFTLPETNCKSPGKLGRTPKEKDPLPPCFRCELLDSRSITAHVVSDWQLVFYKKGYAESLTNLDRSKTITLLLMEEILHHLGRKKPRKIMGKTANLNWRRISSINSIISYFQLVDHPVKVRMKFKPYSYHPWDWYIYLHDPTWMVDFFPNA